MVTPLAWILTLVAIAALFALDLVVSARREGGPTFAAAAGWSVFYIGTAIMFGVVLGVAGGWSLGGQYFAGYVVEKSLSVDNLFVFVIVMSTFAVSEAHQPRVLTLGILAALLLRGVFIALGAALLDAFAAMFLVFGLVLLFTAVQLMRHRAEEPAIEDNPIVRIARRTLPLTDRYDGDRFTTRDGARRRLTPLALVLIVIAGTDVLFALDSIPAVFGVTQHTYIVFAANAFALLGLRALFYLVSGLLDRLVHLSAGLAVILAFIGAKLILHFLHHEIHGAPEISTGLSLAVIGVVLVATGFASWVTVRRDPSRRARPGALRDEAEHPGDRHRAPSEFSGGDPRLAVSGR